MAPRLSEILAAGAFQVRTFPEGTRTADDAARAIGCTIGQIVKSLVFVSGQQPVIALVSGSNRLDTSRLAAAVGDGSPIKKADAETTRAATGFAIGGVPPFGYLTSLPVFIDPDLLEYDVVWAAAGRPDSVFGITPARLVELSGASVANLREERA